MSTAWHHSCWSNHLSTYSENVRRSSSTSPPDLGAGPDGARNVQFGFGFDGLARKMQSIEVAGLRGATPKGGWRTAEHGPEEVLHTLVAVHTDEGIIGYGSISTSDELARAAIKVLEKHWKGENALEPERVSEKLHRATFWLGRGGSITHAISGIDIALWDVLGKVTGQPVGRLLGGRYREKVQPYASLLMDEPEVMSSEILELREAGFGAFKIGWGPFWRVSSKNDEKIAAAAREAAGDNARLM